METFGLEWIHPDEFRVPLAPDILAQFEPMSGLLIVNATFERVAEVTARRNMEGTFDVDDDGRQLISAINHETYHYFQTIGTGYLFLHASSVALLVSRHIEAVALREFVHELPTRLLHVAGLLVYGWTKHWRDRWGRTMGILLEAQRIARRRRQAESGDASWAAATYPELFRELEQAEQKMWEQTPEGLSALGVLETSALIYEHALTSGRAGLQARIEQELEYHDDTYGRAYEVARALCGARAVDVILPASALALRYATPAEAFPYFVERLAAAEEGAEIAVARALGGQLPDISRAGPRLGTAADVRDTGRRQGRRFGIYDRELGLLGGRGWGLDEIDLLADPTASARVPSFPLGMVLRDRVIPGHVSTAELMVRMMAANLILRLRSRPKRERDFARRLAYITGHSLGLYATDEEAADLPGSRPPPQSR